MKVQIEDSSGKVEWLVIYRIRSPDGLRELSTAQLGKTRMRSIKVEVPIRVLVNEILAILAGRMKSLCGMIWNEIKQLAASLRRRES